MTDKKRLREHYGSVIFPKSGADPYYDTDDPRGHYICMEFAGHSKAKFGSEDYWIWMETADGTWRAVDNNPSWVPLAHAIAREDDPDEGLKSMVPVEMFHESEREI